MYKLLARIFPVTDLPQITPDRILVIRTCCIGDVVIATAILKPLRSAYPDAEITWAVSRWARQVVDNHPLIDAILDTGSSALPVKSPTEFFSFVRQIRRGKYDLIISLVRSPLMSLAAWLSGVPYRAGIDSNGRGFGYNIRAPISPDEIRHEALIYLDVLRVLGLNSEGNYTHIPVSEENRQTTGQLLKEHGIKKPYIVINPAGGTNPGMKMVSKRYPLEKLAFVINHLCQEYEASPIIIGGKQDADLVNTLNKLTNSQSHSFAGVLSFSQIGALAADALLYIGNDTGLTHLAAATGTKTIMIMGPSDPRRYAPFAPNAMAIWKPWDIGTDGVNIGHTRPFDWEKDGIDADEVLGRIRAFLKE